MARILCCGIVALDVINQVPHYPAEDEELRATAQERRIGGNAANTCSVLAQHGHDVALAATVAKDEHGDWLLTQLVHAKVNTGHCLRLPGATPTSYILLNQHNGSRTIVHYRDLAELPAEHIQQAIHNPYEWLHFEGRNVAALQAVLKQLPPERGYGLSIEAEKPREGLEALFPLADVVMLSRPWAEAAGYTEPAALLQALQQQYPQQQFTCTWGKHGAWFCGPQDNIGQVPANLVAKVIDTIGAGDAFNAGLIHQLTAGATLESAVHYATALASRKVTQHGIAGLVQLAKQAMNGVQMQP